MDLGGAAPPEGGSPDVFADTPADGGLGEEPTVPPVQEGSLGGDGGTLEELGEEQPLPPDEAPINGGGTEEPPPAGEQPPAQPEPEPEPEPEPAPEPPAPKAKPASKKGGGKKGTTERRYVVLQSTTVQVGEGETEERWVEAVPEGIVATNGEAALRKAYADLVPEDNGDPVTLCVIPEHYWKPKTVQAKVRHERAVEIS